MEVSSKVASLKDPQEIQTLIFDTARSSGLEPSELFKAIYRLLLGVERGPRLGPYILDIGPAKVAERFRRAASS